jgi:catechol 2,3-dioxygenase-like lactoylglutathione lyase family enzyme
VNTTARVTSSVIFVGDVDRSVAFYSELLGCTAAIHDRDAALLLGQGGFQIYLIEQGPRAPHHSGGVGIQCLIWAVDSAEELTDVEEALQGRGIRTDRHASGGATFVTGRDPDGIRIMVAHPSPEELPRSVVGARLYS